MRQTWLFSKWSQLIKFEIINRKFVHQLFYEFNNQKRSNFLKSLNNVDFANIYQLLKNISLIQIQQFKNIYDFITHYVKNVNMIVQHVMFWINEKIFVYFKNMNKKSFLYHDLCTLLYDVETTSHRFEIIVLQNQIIDYFIKHHIVFLNENVKQFMIVFELKKQIDYMNRFNFFVWKNLLFHICQLLKKNRFQNSFIQSYFFSSFKIKFHFFVITFN